MRNRANPFELAICWLLVGILFSVYGLIRLGFTGNAIRNLNEISLKNNVCCMGNLDTGIVEK